MVKPFECATDKEGDKEDEDTSNNLTTTKGHEALIVINAQGHGSIVAGIMNCLSYSLFVLKKTLFGYQNQRPKRVQIAGHDDCDGVSVQW